VALAKGVVVAKTETERFTSFAASFDAGRPGYPAAVGDLIFDGLGDPRGLTVADLGAGTGTSARLLAQRGASVFAIEPNAAMRAKAVPAPGVTWLDAAAEKTGLADGSVDVVTAFQAFHWFAGGATFAEIARILKPAGRGVVVFYERDDRDAFTAAYSELVRRFATDETERRRVCALEAFAAWERWRRVRRFTLEHEHVLDAAGMVERVRSTSYLPQTGPRSERLMAAAMDLFDRHAIGGRVRMCLQTLVVIGDR
jgi:SAM-dependent methyltransferase